MAVYGGSASLIKVDPSILESSGQDIQGNGQNVSSSGSKALTAAEGAPSYNGQFGPKVAAIGQEAFARACGLAVNLTDLGERVLAKGMEFEAVDVAAIAALDPIFDENALLALWSKLTGLSIQELEAILKLATLLGDPALFFGLIISIIIGQNPSIHPPIPPTTIPPSNNQFQSPTSTSVNDPNNPLYHFGDPYGSGKWAGYPHPGLDIPGAIGDPVHPIGDGKVVYVHDDPGGYGHYVVIEHELADGSKIYSLYAHLDPASTESITNGTLVNKETVIGTIGTTGDYNTPHLHLEIRTEQGFTVKDSTVVSMKGYADAKNDLGKYWLNPQEVIGNPSYSFNPTAS